MSFRSVDRLPIADNNDPCGILKNFITKRNGKVGYTECAYFLNNYTDMTQIQIYTCLNIFFPYGQDLNNSYGNKWTAIL